MATGTRVQGLERPFAETYRSNVDLITRLMSSDGLTCQQETNCDMNTCFDR